MGMVLTGGICPFCIRLMEYNSGACTVKKLGIIAA